MKDGFRNFDVLKDIFHPEGFIILFFLLFYFFVFIIFLVDLSNRLFILLVYIVIFFPSSGNPIFFLERTISFRIRFCFYKGVYILPIGCFQSIFHEVRNFCDFLYIQRVIYSNTGIDCYPVSYSPCFKLAGPHHSFGSVYYFPDLPVIFFIKRSFYKFVSSAVEESARVSEKVKTNKNRNKRISYSPVFSGKKGTPYAQSNKTGEK